MLTGCAVGRYAALEDGAAAALAEATLLGPAAVQRMDAQVPGGGGPGCGEAASPRPGAAGALPSHISIFGEGSGGGAELGGAEIGGVGGVRLPSHISAFGDDSEGVEGGELGGRVAGLVSHALDGVEPSPREGTPPGACGKRLGVYSEALDTTCGLVSHALEGMWAKACMCKLWQPRSVGHGLQPVWGSRVRACEAVLTIHGPAGRRAVHALW